MCLYFFISKSCVQTSGNVVVKAKAKHKGLVKAGVSQVTNPWNTLKLK